VASYDALINLKLKGLKDLKKVENIVDKINKPVRTANTRSRVEQKLAKSTEARRVAMIETRRVGDLIQKGIDKGLKLSKARNAVDKSALANQKGEFKVSKAQLKVALDELNVQTKITEQLGKQNAARAKSMLGGPSVSSGIASSRFGSTRQPGSPRFIASRAGMMQGPAAPPYAPGMYGSSPIGGSKFMFGSPAQVAFSGSGMGRSPILGSKDLVGSPKNILDIAKQNTLPVKGLPSLVGSPAYYDAQNKEFKRIAKANAMPVQGFKHLVGSPAYLKDQQQKMQKLIGGDTGFSAAQYGPQQPMQGPRMFGQAFDPTGGSSALNFDKRTGRLLQGPAGSSRNTRGNLMRRFGPTKGFDAQSALISGAFPLLFGQGPVGAAAGALGGGIGGMFGTMGGFAGGIAATALVQQIQTAITAISNLGKALGPFTQNTEAVVNSLGLQNSVQQAQIQLIEQVEGKTAAFNAAMKLMANDIGERGVNALKQFGESSRILSSQFTLAITKLQAFAAGVANFVLRITGLEQALKKADAARVVESSAIGGNTEALGLIQRQKQIDKMGSRGGEGRRKDTLQEELDLDKQLFAARESAVTQAKLLNQESTSLIQKLQDEVDLRNRVEELMKEGNSKTLAEKLAKNEQIFEKERQNAELLMERHQRDIDFLSQKGKLNDTEQQKLDETVAKRDAINKLLQDYNNGLITAQELTKQLNTATDKYKVTLDEVKDVLASGMTNAIMGLIDGTKTLSEALAGIAKQLASMFLNAAFKNIFNFSEQGSYSRAGGFKAFQYGGVVNQPTLGLMGEGGEPEYVIPASKMDGAMARYSAGARGGAVIPGGSHESGTVAGSSGNTVVEYTGPTLNFNGDEYVPKSAVPDIIGAASKQGAMAGKAQVIGSLKNSRSQRSSLGL
jgi:hypothetical protein